MIKELINKIPFLDFLKSAGIVFVANIFIAALNYGIQILVAHNLSTELSSWTALNSLFIILSFPIVGLRTFYTREISAFSKDSIEKTKAFKNFLIKKTLPIIGFGLLLSPVFVLSLRLFLPFNSDSLFLVVIALLIQLISIWFSEYIIGVLHIKNYVIALIGSNIIKLLTVLIGLEIGLGIVALPLSFLMQFASVIVISSSFEKVKIRFNDSIASYKFDFLRVIKDSAQTMVALGILYFTIYSSSIISDRYFNEQDRDLFSVLFSFGQIIHFGSLAFMSVFVAQSSKSNNNKIYLVSSGIITLFTICIGVGFVLFGEIILTIYNRLQYLDQLYLIVIYSIFVAFYNLFFLSVQHYIAKKNFKMIYRSIVIPILLIISMLISVNITIINNVILQFVGINILIMFIGALSVFLSIAFEDRKVGVDTIDTVS
jgi:O-antigen/teichoic acid export membrane protein